MMDKYMSDDLVRTMLSLTINESTQAANKSRIQTYDESEMRTRQK